VGEGASVRDCRGIGRMGVMCIFGIVGYLASGECSRCRDSGVKGGGSKERRWRNNERMEEKG
jgi:hypothetical protein